MGLDVGTFLKKLIIDSDRLLSTGKNQLLATVLDEGVTWKASGKAAASNPFVVSGKCVAFMTDCELLLHSLWRTDQAVPLSQLANQFFQQTVAPFIDGEGYLTKFVFLAFDNSSRKPKNKAETAKKRAEASAKYVVEDRLIPTSTADHTVPSIQSVMATTAYKHVLYNYLLQQLYARVHDLPTREHCGVVVATPYSDYNTFKIKGLAVYDPEIEVLSAEATFFLTGIQCVFTRGADLRLPDLNEDFPYGEGDMLLRVYSDVFQACYPELFDGTGAYIVVVSKDSDSLPIFLLRNPGPVTLLLGTARGEWLGGKEDKALFISMARLRQALQLDTAKAAARFALACVMGGTDYITRPAGIGADRVLGAFYTWASNPPRDRLTLPKILRAKEDREIFKSGADSGMVVLQPKEVVAAVEMQWYKSTGRSDFAANYAKMNNRYKRILWNMRYWFCDDPHTGGPDPLQSGWRVNRADEPPGYWPLEDTSAAAAAAAPTTPVVFKSAKPNTKTLLGEAAKKQAPEPQVKRTADRGHNPLLDFGTRPASAKHQQQQQPAPPKRPTQQAAPAATAAKKKHVFLSEDEEERGQGSDEERTTRPPTKKSSVSYPVAHAPSPKHARKTTSYFIDDEEEEEETVRRVPAAAPAKQPPKKTAAPAMSTTGLDWDSFQRKQALGTLDAVNYAAAFRTKKADSDPWG